MGNKEEIQQLKETVEALQLTLLGYVQSYNNLLKVLESQGIIKTNTEVVDYDI